jgi:hypothetical protein
MKLKSLKEAHIRPDRYIEGWVVYFMFNIVFCGVFMTCIYEYKHFFQNAFTFIVSKHELSHHEFQCHPKTMRGNFNIYVSLTKYP